MTKQPQWHFLANLGDVHPLDHGGLFVFVDKTGVYGAEAVRIEPVGGKIEVRRFGIDRCTDIAGVLSDNRFHPDKPTWFKPADLASFCGESEWLVRQWLCDADPLVRARAWELVGLYYGWDNLDSYPLTQTRSEVRRRYRAAFRK